MGANVSYVRVEEGGRERQGDAGRDRTEGREEYGVVEEGGGFAGSPLNVRSQCLHDPFSDRRLKAERQPPPLMINIVRDSLCIFACVLFSLLVRSLSRT